MNADREAAIATVKFSRQTHVEWAAFLRQNPSHNPGVIGDAEYHERAVREYDNVLNVLLAERCPLGGCPHYVAAIAATIVGERHRADALTKPPDGPVR